jgi:hypothetical protein
VTPGTVASRLVTDYPTTSLFPKDEGSMRYLFLSAIVISVVACRSTPETGSSGNASASPYTADADTDSSARDDALEGTNSGTELEAPRLIPALKNQLGLMRRGSAVKNEDNLLAYKNLAQDVINSMVADMHRAGYSDTGNFGALKDSVLDDIGGGAGSGPDLDRSELPAHLQRMQRLIDQYQSSIRSAADKL